MKLLFSRKRIPEIAGFFGRTLKITGAVYASVLIFLVMCNLGDSYG